MDSIRDLIATIINTPPRVLGAYSSFETADAILAHPDIRAIIDLAATYQAWAFDNKFDGDLLDFEPFEKAAIALETPEARALLSAWRNDA